jgi:hypothetical protein
MVKDDYRARHSRIAVTWQIAIVVVFSGLLDENILSSDLAGLCLQAKTQARHEKAVLRFGSAVVENQRDRPPGGDQNRCRRKFEFRGNDPDFGGFDLVRGRKRRDLCLRLSSATPCKASGSGWRPRPPAASALREMAELDDNLALTGPTGNRTLAAGNLFP